MGAALALSTQASPAKFSTGELELLMSKTHARNLLPHFLFSEGAEEGGGSAVPIGGGRGGVDRYPICDLDRRVNLH